MSQQTAEPDDIDPDDIDPDVDPDDDPEDDPDDGKPPAYKAPTQAEWERAQKKIARLEGRARQASKTASATRTKPAPKGGTVEERLLAALKADDPDDGKGSGRDDDDEVNTWKTRAARGDAASQLTAAGFQGSAKSQARLTRLLDIEGAKPDKEGNFDFEDEIEDLKDEYPELFKERAQAKPRPRVRTSDSSRTPEMDATAKTSDRMLKEAGYR